jgi:transposase-like protein
MSRELRLTLEERIKAVEECIDGKDNTNNSARKHGINKSTLRCWIRLYKKRGIAGITPSIKNRSYSTELKRNAVEDYLSGEGSLNDICMKYDISRHTMLQLWIKCYNNRGEFNQPKSGGVNYMVKGRGTTLEERIEIVSHCISNNKDYGRTIEKYSVSYQQIYGWVKKYEAEGIDSLVDRRGKRKDEDSLTEIEKLRAKLKLKEAENQRLQMENDLLKKLEALERGQGKV